MSAAQKRCCINQMTAAFVEFGLCADTLNLMLFPPFFFYSFLTGSLTAVITTLFFSFPPLAVYGLCAFVCV